MKKKLLVFMMMITLLVMVGCGSNTAGEDQTAADDQAAEQTEDVQDDAEAVQDDAEAAQDEADVDIGEVESKADQISEKEAKAIVLKHAGLKEKDVEFTKFKKDKDDGVWQYEIEFVSGDQEYEYDVRMSDGKILDYDVDSRYDD